jgi:hypothetical protein
VPVLQGGQPSGPIVNPGGNPTGAPPSLPLPVPSKPIPPERRTAGGVQTPPIVSLPRTR